MSLKLLLLLLTAVVVQATTHDELQVLRWNSAKIAPHRLHETQVIVKRIQTNWARYTAVSRRTGVPPEVIAGLHNMESGGSFTRHLHEGSRLTARTQYVPKGRPKTGSPPFTWEYSAEDAMNYDSMGSKNWSKLGPALTACEWYNGSGYARYHPSTPSPYLWAGTSVERPGKYTGDGVWSSTARSSQIGVATIWKEMQRQNLIKIPRP